MVPKCNRCNIFDIELKFPPLTNFEKFARVFVIFPTKSNSSHIIRRNYDQHIQCNDLLFFGKKPQI